jgi:hypothetical protein
MILRIPKLDISGLEIPPHIVWWTQRRGLKKGACVLNLRRQLEPADRLHDHAQAEPIEEIRRAVVRFEPAAAGTFHAEAFIDPKLQPARKVIVQRAGGAEVRQAVRGVRNRRGRSGPTDRSERRIGTKRGYLIVLGVSRTTSESERQANEGRPRLAIMGCNWRIYNFFLI